MTRHPHGATVTRLRSGGSDRFGNPLPETEHDIEDCPIAPGQTEDVIDRSNGAIADFVIYPPPGSDIRHTDRVRLPQPWGGVWQVTGVPQHWISPWTGNRPGMRVYLTGRQS